MKRGKAIGLRVFGILQLRLRLRDDGRRFPLRLFKLAQSARLRILLGVQLGGDSLERGDAVLLRLNLICLRLENRASIHHVARQLVEGGRSQNQHEHRPRRRRAVLAAGGVAQRFATRNHRLLGIKRVGGSRVDLLLNRGELGIDLVVFFGDGLHLGLSSIERRLGIGDIVGERGSGDKGHGEKSAQSQRAHREDQAFHLFTCTEVRSHQFPSNGQ